MDWTKPVAEVCRLRGMFAAFAALGVVAKPVVYADNEVERVRDELLGLDGVLVWVNPIEQGLDRSRLDPLLREAAEAGVWVSAHPNVILKMGTKQVLVDTRGMSWGTDTRLYRTPEELRDGLPGRLARGAPLVLKQYRGMGGNGVWKIELTDPSAEEGEPARVRVQHAAGGGAPELTMLSEFLERCEPYFAGSGRMIEQPFQPRLVEGMIRVYLSHETVVGFAHQKPRGLLPPLPTEQPPTATRFERASAHRYRTLKARMEQEWLPELERILDVDAHSLPVIWDADFLFGPTDERGDNSYVLCEINVSSTFAFPEHAMLTVAETALARIREQATSVSVASE